MGNRTRYKIQKNIPFVEKPERWKIKAKTTRRFIAFAPMNNPKIAIAVFIENAGFGADVAAPIAAQIIKKALKR